MENQISSTPHSPQTAFKQKGWFIFVTGFLIFIFILLSIFWWYKTTKITNLGLKRGQLKTQIEELRKQLEAQSSTGPLTPLPTPTPITSVPLTQLEYYKSGFILYSSSYEDLWIADLQGRNRFRILREQPLFIAIADDGKEIGWIAYDQTHKAISTLDFNTGVIKELYSPQDIYINEGKTSFDVSSTLSGFTYLPGSKDMAICIGRDIGIFKKDESGITKISSLQSDLFADHIEAFLNRKQLLVDKKDVSRSIPEITDISGANTILLDSLESKSGLRSQLSPSEIYVYKIGKSYEDVYFKIYNTKTKETKDLSVLVPESDSLQGIISSRNLIAFKTQKGRLGFMPNEIVGQIFTVKPDGTDLKQIYEGDQKEIYLLGWSQDGNVLYFTELSQGLGLQIVRLNTNTDEKQVLLTDLDRLNNDMSVFQLYAP